MIVPLNTKLGSVVIVPVKVPVTPVTPAGEVMLNVVDPVTPVRMLPVNVPERVPINAPVMVPVNVPFGETYPPDRLIVIAPLTPPETNPLLVPWNVAGVRKIPLPE